jgi:hypothetical protein
VSAVTRRAALGALSVLALAACSDAGAAPAPTPVAARPRLHTRWTGRPDGPLPAAGDEGVPLRAVSVDGAAAPAAIRGGGLVGNLPDAPGAVYVLQQLPTRLRTIGARFGFGPGSSAGSLCLAAWTAEPATDTNCHMVLTPDRWIYSIARDHALIHLGDGPLDLPQDGTPLTVQVDLDGGPTALLSLPDGHTQTVVDPGIATIPGVVANWEFYKDAAGATDVRLYETWAA